MTNAGDDRSAEDREGQDAPQGETLNEGVAADAAPSGAPGEEEVDFTVFEEDLGEDSVLLQVQKKLEETEDELARSRAETYNVQQQYGNYVRRSKAEAGERRVEGREDVIEALIPVLDDIEAARQAGELGDGPFASIAAKLEDTLGGRFGLERYGAAGDEFDPQLHDALMAQTNPDVTEPMVGQVLQPGYRVKERVLRPTKVLVDNPE